VGRARPAALSKDAKTRLQEWLQARRTAGPEYAVTALGGEAHAQTFTIECRIPALGIVATGTGASRRAAEQVAAERAYALVIAQSGASRRG
jgi:ribonuclease-3